MATLQILGSYGMDIELEFAEIQRDFGDGYDANELVGNSAGELFYRLVFDFLPDSLELTVTDPEDGSAVKTYQDYLWDFFVRRKQNGDAFDVVDPRTGSTVSVKLTDIRLSYKFLTYKLFSTGLLLRQHRS